MPFYNRMEAKGTQAGGFPPLVHINAGETRQDGSLAQTEACYPIKLSFYFSPGYMLGVFALCLNFVWEFKQVRFLKAHLPDKELPASLKNRKVIL